MIIKKQLVFVKSLVSFKQIYSNLLNRGCHDKEALSKDYEKKRLQKIHTK